ncbi:HWE histidine kinase domain-containing protein [Mesorhizobium caraganae]|uniref:HWE histidine kinase domain-containing protein n=1 Tax=Mesorhizobium caraganae TaxID=483206 RepID=UPI003334CC19
MVPRNSQIPDRLASFRKRYRGARASKCSVILSMTRETSNRSGQTRMFEKQVRERFMALSRSHDLFCLY